jgi:hypothetical protein
MICIACGAHFKRTAFHQGPECEDCYETLVSPYDPDVQLDIDSVVNRSAKTQPVFYEDRDEDDSHGL